MSEKDEHVNAESSSQTKRGFSRWQKLMLLGVVGVNLCLYGAMFLISRQDGTAQSAPELTVGEPLELQAAYQQASGLASSWQPDVQLVGVTTNWQLASGDRLTLHRQAWSFIVCKFLTDPVWWFFLIWLPDYFKKTRGLDIKTSWVHLVVIYAIVTVLSIAGGWLAGYLANRGWTVTRARKTSMFIFALCVLPIFFATQVGDWGAVLLIGLAGAAHQAWSANLFTTVSDMFPKQAVASVVGIGGLAGSVGGMLFPVYSGRLLDRFVAIGDPTAGYAVLFGICGSAYLVAFVLQHLLAPRFVRIDAAE